MGSFLLYAGCVGFIVGIFVRSFFILGLPVILWGLVVSVGLWLIWRRKSKAFSSPYLLALSVFLFLFSLGALRMEVASWGERNVELESQLASVVSLEGEVVREPDVRASSQHLYVQVDDELLLVTTDRYAEVSYGDVVTFEGTLDVPKAFQTDLGRTFNYKGYLEAKGVHYVVSFAHIKVISGGNGNPLITQLLDTKHAFMSRIEAVIPQPYVGLSEGLLLGVKQALGDELESAFRTTGIIHIVVLSGYNIMLVVMFVTYVLAFVLPLRWRLVFGALAILCFALLVGLSATVVRASSMVLLALVAKATGRTYAVVRALVLTGIVMLILNPYLLVYDVGFQLSFVATLGLILISSYLETHLGFMPTLFKLREFLTATVATQIFVTPILLYQIGQFSVVAIIVNLLVLPMVPVAMLLTFATGMIGFFSATLSLPFAFASYLSLAYITKIAVLFAGLPFASFTVPAFPFYIVVAVYALFAWILWRLFARVNRKSILKAHTALVGWTIVDEAEFKRKPEEGRSSSSGSTIIHTS